MQVENVHKTDQVMRYKIKTNGVKVAVYQHQYMHLFSSKGQLYQIELDNDITWVLRNGQGPHFNGQKENKK